MDRLDPEPDCAGSVLHPAGDQHRGDVRDPEVDPDPDRGPDAAQDDAIHAGGDGRDVRVLPRGRSEEHTSELQSLMRISYAVFCLKKKTKKKHNYYNINI